MSHHCRLQYYRACQRPLRVLPCHPASHVKDQKLLKAIEGLAVLRALHVKTKVSLLVNLVAIGIVSSYHPSSLMSSKSVNVLSFASSHSRPHSQSHSSSCHSFRRLPWWSTFRHSSRHLNLSPIIAPTSHRLSCHLHRRCSRHSSRRLPRRLPRRLSRHLSRRLSRPRVKVLTEVRLVTRSAFCLHR